MLYLQVQAPDGGVSDGDTSPFPTATNNVQQVLIAAPVADAYTIRVHGVSVTQQAPGASPGAAPRQDFALAVSNGVSTGASPDGDEEDRRDHRLDGVLRLVVGSPAHGHLRHRRRPPGHDPVAVEWTVGPAVVRRESSCGVK